MTDLDAELIAAAEGIFKRWSGLEALARCEWDPVVDVNDAGALRSLGSLFRAHGRTLAVTPALGVLAATALDRRAPPVGDGVKTSGFNVTRDDDQVRFVCIGGLPGAQIVLDVPGVGVATGDCAAAVSHRSNPLDPQFVQSMSICVDALEPVEDPSGDGRRLAEALVRIAIAHEMLGICDAVLKLAIEYAAVRFQFGQPVGNFQAVQHLLAEAAVDAEGLQAACQLAMWRPLESDDYEQTALYLKALAGRASRRVLQASLQTLGAIGFTWEHDHHRYTRRLLTLDAIGGTADDLARTIGLRARAGVLWRPSVSFEGDATV